MTPILSRHVLFDLDGTLVDTRASVVECYKRVFRNLLDRPFPPDTIDTGLLFAMRPREVFFLVAPDRVEELYQAYHETYPRCTDKIKVFDGVKDLINALGASGRKPSLVTNKGLDRTLVDLSVADIAPDAFTVIVTAEDTADRKPHPAPILLGLERAGATPAESVYVGDGPQDIIAARAAHLPCIAVSYGFYDRAVLEAEKPTAIVDSIRELSSTLGVATANRAAS